MNYKELKNIVYNFPTSNREGFIQNEQEELLKQFPKCNMNKYYDAMRGNTCMMREGNIITYHCDVLTALTCGLENRDINQFEFD